MTHSGLALFVAAVMVRGRDETKDNEHGRQFRGGAQRARRGPRGRVPGDPQVAEDDYYRFLNAPRGW
jgi:hypothetical protein